MGARPSSFKRAAEVDAPVASEAAVASSRQIEWSVQQQDVFEWFKDDMGRRFCVSSDLCSPHLIVRARAGTGKTTTIIEGVNRAPEASILLCAFNKKTEEQMTRRISNRNAEAKTMHSLGFRAIRREWPWMKVAEGSARADWLTEQVVEKQCPRQIRRLIGQLHTKARDMMPLEPTYPDMLALMHQFDLAPEEGWGFYGVWQGQQKRVNCDDNYVVTKALRAMGHARHVAPDGSIGIDFSDMIFLPLAWNLLSKDYQLVVVDEAQDLTVAQLEIARRMCDGRICIVGDDRQAIYKFRGADSDSLDRLKAELQAEELPLTVTYRCCQAVVRLAQDLVPDIQAAPSNPEGTVDTTDYETMLETVKVGDFIVSRLNAPLAAITMTLLRRGVRARMSGRDIGKGLMQVVRKLKVQDRDPVQKVVDRLEQWRVKQTTKYAANGMQAMVDKVNDQTATLEAIAVDAGTVQELLRTCESLFVDDPTIPQVTCSSIHKVKGLEAERVYLLEESLYRRGDTQEECNCHYVGMTRAKAHLTRVVGVPRLC